ncbi:hypothetical protein FXO38_16716 [Capsicum annuum]|nr:hypothetical protein FXO38_16716 [Capsicum annuum]
MDISSIMSLHEDSFLDVIWPDAARLVRLRHPGFQAHDKSKNCMAMVTEPLFASPANALGNLDNIDKVAKELKGMADAALLVRLRHPGIVHVVQALDESKNYIDVVVEPSFSSTANALGDSNSIDKVPKELKGMENKGNKLKREIR